MVTVPERYEAYEASIASLENTKDLSIITFTEVIHVLQAQEQRRLMREDHETVEGNLNYTEDNALIVKKNRRSKYNNTQVFPSCPHCKRKGHQHRFFHLVPIAREKVINPIGVGGGQMSNVTNAVNWDMWKINQMRINQRRIYLLQHHVSQPTNLQKIGL